ncbi:MAG TPA: hypothetical protein VGE04_11350, partial [Chloroflexia bacterium]
MNSGARLALVLLLVALVAGGLVLLAAQYSVGQQPIDVASRPTAIVPTGSVSSSDRQTRTQSPTNPPANTPAAPQTETAQALPTSTVVATSLTPTPGLFSAERTLQVLDAEQVPVRD